MRPEISRCPICDKSWDPSRVVLEVVGRMAFVEHLDPSVFSPRHDVAGCEWQRQYKAELLAQLTPRERVWVG